MLLAVSHPSPRTSILYLIFLWARCSAHELEAGSEKTVRLSNATRTWLWLPSPRLCTAGGIRLRLCCWTRHMILPTCTCRHSSQPSNRRPPSDLSESRVPFCSLACIKPPVAHTPFIWAFLAGGGIAALSEARVRERGVGM
ncbi:hypothetical protein V8C26DRAFT_413066 [Trichoderma gracile]